MSYITRTLDSASWCPILPGDWTVLLDILYYQDIGQCLLMSYITRTLDSASWCPLLPGHWTVLPDVLYYQDIGQCFLMSYITRTLNILYVIMSTLLLSDRNKILNNEQINNSITLKLKPIMKKKKLSISWKSLILYVKIFFV